MLTDGTSDVSITAPSPLSSSCYGPEEAFLALGEHTHLALYMVAATALTVFVIAVGYNQVIELFPSGGGGYKVATNLIGPYTGLVSGAALIVDYMLTIAISVASGGFTWFARAQLSTLANCAVGTVNLASVD
jgi:amino acid transporter